MQLPAARPHPLPKLQHLPRPVHQRAARPALHRPILPRLCPHPALPCSAEVVRSADLLSYTAEEGVSLAWSLSSRGRGRAPAAPCHARAAAAAAALSSAVCGWTASAAL